MTNRFSLIKFICITLVVFLTSCKNKKAPNHKPSLTTEFKSDSTNTISKVNEAFRAHKTASPLKIDGDDKDAIWTMVDWHDMNYVWMGENVDPSDYQGHFKLAWDAEYLYILVEVIDEHLNPTLKDGIENYWKGDYVEVFIDEDQSGGLHKFNHQAFAYHVSTEGHTIDKNTSQEIVFFDDHVNVKRTQKGNKHLWEMAIRLFEKQFDENANNNIPVKIFNQKKIGFSIAYGDNDGNSKREHFVGSKKTHGIDNDEGYINADVFGSILFVE